MIYKSILARIGIQKYHINGVYTRVLRKELTIKDSLNSYLNVPVTIGHDEDAKVVGNVLEVSYEDGLVKGVLEITDESVIKSYNKISCGYTCSLKPNSGKWLDVYGIHGTINDYYDYDYEQSEIKVDHVALVSNPRAGVLTRLLLDSESNTTNNLMTVQDNTLSNMSKIVYKDKEFDVSDDSLVGVFQELNSELQTLKGKLAALSTKDSKETKVDETKLVKIGDCIALWSSILPAIKTKDENYNPNYNLKPYEIKLEYIKTFKPDLVKDENNLTEDYISGIWSVIQPNFSKVNSVNADLGNVNSVNSALKIIR